MSGTYAFLLDAYETEILKTIGVWRAFPEDAMEFRPADKSRTVIEQFEHQVQSEGNWMGKMLGVDVGEFNPPERTKGAFMDKYLNDAGRRLEQLRTKHDRWWQEQVEFFDVKRSRAWVMLRRLSHSAHHRGQLIVYLRVLEAKVPSVYGPTADTQGKVQYNFDQRDAA